MSLPINSRYFSNWTQNRVLFFILFIVSTADASAITLGGINIRIAWVLLPFLVMLLPYSDEEKVSLYFALALFAAHLISGVYSGNIISAVMFSFWILFNYFFFFRSGYIISKFIGTDVWDLFLILGRFQIIVGCLMNFVGINDRTQFIYYEPSYLAMGLVPYIFAAVFWSKTKIIDYLIIALALVTSQSANMAVGVTLVALFMLIRSGKLHVVLALLAIMIFMTFTTFFIILNNPANPNYGIVSWINENGVGFDLIYEIFGRAGNRIPRIEAAIEVLSSNWWLGLGPGNYIPLTEKMEFYHITGGVDYYDPAGLPPINVIIEAVINSGVMGGVILLVYSIYVISKSVMFSDGVERWIMGGALLTFFLMLQIESGYLRAYLWFIFGAFLARSQKLSDG